MKRWCPKCKDYENVREKENWFFWDSNLFLCEKCGYVFDRRKNLVEEFCEFAWLADNADALEENSAAEKPTLTWDAHLLPSLKDRGNIPKELVEKLEGWNAKEDISVLTPAGLEFLLYMAKEFWRRYGD